MESVIQCGDLVYSPGTGTAPSTGQVRLTHQGIAAASARRATGRWSTHSGYAESVCSAIVHDA